MVWAKRPRAAVVLTNEHLDTITSPNRYVVQFGAYATAANGYPYDEVPGFLEVLQWRDGQPLQVFIPWDGGYAVVKRSCLSGVWRPWRDLMGVTI